MTSYDAGADPFIDLTGQSSVGLAYFATVFARTMWLGTGNSERV